MKFQFAFTFLIGLNANFAFGQTMPNYATLNSNNVKLVISANGTIGYNPTFEKGSWMPANDSAGTIFAVWPWISGTNDQEISCLLEFKT